MRRKNSIFNIIGTIGSYLLVIIFNFITQRYIVKILGVEYSGINGLFTNILTMLSIAELGIGTTIIYKLYKPIADKDIESIKSWMKFYKICYRYVALFVSVVGAILIPFIPLIVGNVSINENITVLYIISVLDVVFSYVMTYKRSLLYANQKNYIVNIIHMGYIFFMNTTQIIVLVLLKNYIIFVIVKLIYRILENLIINILVNKKYPYVKEYANDISKNEKKDILKRISAMFLQKISFVVNKGIDNVLISLFLGIAAVGYYTNYNIVVSGITSVIYQIVSSLTASVGNLLTENNRNKSYEIYKSINMFNSFFTCICMVGFGCAIEPFIKVWIGEKYILDNYIMLSFVIYIYSDSIRRSITIFKDAAGICKEDRHMYVIMTIINLVCSVILCKFIGVSGVILGTAISYIFLIIYSYPKYIFKPIFRKSIKYYYMENFKYICFILISFVLSYSLCQLISISIPIAQLALNCVLVVVTTTTLFIVLFRKTNEYKYYKNMIVGIVCKIPILDRRKKIEE